MTKKLPEGSAVARLATDVFAPAAIEFLFWKPRHLLDSPSVAHLPLLFWVCAALRPHDVAVVGVGDGVVHFALCQALEKFNEQGRCTGYGFWKDTASPGSATSIPPKLASHHAMLYEEVAQLVESHDPDEVADGLSQGSLDLLWLDLSAAPGGLCQRAELFSRALKRTGVMFIHGVGSVPENSPDGAAIKRLLNSHRFVKFDDEQGLLLVVFDGDVPTRIEALVSTSESALLSPEVEKVFRRVGQGLLSTVRAADALIAQKNAETRATEARAAHERAETALENLNSAYELRNRKLLEGQSELYDTRLLVAELKAQMAAIDAERISELFAHEKALEGAEQNLEAVNTEADGLRNQVAAAEEARLALEADHENALKGSEQNLDMNRDSLQSERTTRFSETAALTRMSEELRNEVTQLKSRNAELAKSLDAEKKLTKQAETKLKAEIENERRTRFIESATLTRMIEELKAEKERKNRRFEAWLVEKLVRSERKLKKYRRERMAFFSDSRSIVARAYFRLRPGQ